MIGRKRMVCKTVETGFRKHYWSSGSDRAMQKSSEQSAVAGFLYASQPVIERRLPLGRNNGLVWEDSLHLRAP
jgi:hypothetical protein